MKSSPARSVRSQIRDFRIKNLKSKFRAANAGFTLIELLVVIGILGILAAALVATIDPFEQLRKARDSRTQNAAVEFQSALIRYYTTHEATPWENNACQVGGANVTNIVVGTTITALEECVDVLIAEGELKQAFTTADGLDEIYVIEPYNTTVGGSPAVDGSPAICYIPESKSGKADDNTRYNRDGSIDASCIDTGTGANTCHWCAE